MSRSQRKPIIKDRPRNYKKSSSYWRTVRRVIKNNVRYLQEKMLDENIPDPKEIVNDYDYSDYRLDYRFKNNENTKKASRK